MPAGSNAYNSLWQVRTDAWSALEESTTQLALAGAQQRPVEQLTDAVAEALDVLAPIERFWAFPGMPAFSRVRQLAFIRSLNTPEAHGYRADLGYRVYVDKALEIAATTPSTSLDAP